jgi:hypothetical protein
VGVSVTLGRGRAKPRAQAYVPRRTEPEKQQHLSSTAGHLATHSTRQSDLLTLRLLHPDQQVSVVLMEAEKNGASKKTVLGNRKVTRYATAEPKTRRQLRPQYALLSRAGGSQTQEYVSSTPRHLKTRSSMAAERLMWWRLHPEQPVSAVHMWNEKRMDDKRVL